MADPPAVGVPAAVAIALAPWRPVGRSARHAREQTALLREMIA
jgi:hypothetical protein